MEEMSHLIQREQSVYAPPPLARMTARKSASIHPTAHFPLFHRLFPSSDPEDQVSFGFPFQVSSDQMIKGFQKQKMRQLTLQHGHR